MLFLRYLIGSLPVCGINIRERVVDTLQEKFLNRKLFTQNLTVFERHIICLWRFPWLSFSFILFIRSTTFLWNVSYPATQTYDDSTVHEQPSHFRIQHLSYPVMQIYYESSVHEQSSHYPGTRLIANLLRQHCSWTILALPGCETYRKPITTTLFMNNPRTTRVRDLSQTYYDSIVHEQSSHYPGTRHIENLLRQHCSWTVFALPYTTLIISSYAKLLRQQCSWTVLALSVCDSYCM